MIRPLSPFLDLHMAASLMDKVAPSMPIEIHWISFNENV